MSGAVGDLVGACFFVLFDRAVLVFVDRAARDDARLRVAVDREMVNIDRFLSVLFENAVANELLKILPPAFESLGA